MADFRSLYNELFKEVIEVFANEYNKGGMLRISKLGEMFENNFYKKTIAEEVYGYLGKRNSNANSRIFRMDNSLKKEIEKTIFNNLFDIED